MISALRRLVLRLVNLVWPGRWEPPLDREIRTHLTMLEEEFARRGMPPHEAARAARLAFGGVAQVKERYRDARSFAWIEDAGRDVRYAMRTLLRTPGFTVLAVLTLTLGIGFVTVIYSVIHDVLLDPLPYPGSDRFVNVAVVDAETGGRRNMLTPAEFLDFQEQSEVFDAVFGTRGDGGVLTTGESAELLRVVRVTPNFFDVMGLPPLMGRALDDRDARPDAPPVAVLRHRAWVSFFAADPGVVGRVIELDGVHRTVIGVMPPRFTWHAADVWIPGAIDRHASGARAARGFQARLQRGVSVREAASHLDVIATRRAQSHPTDYPPNFRVEVVNVIEQVVGDFRAVLYTAFAAVGLLLVIACCNVANMLLARATARQREMTIRAALGAGQGRIVRQMLVESLILGLAGAAGGCLLAYAGITALVPFLPQGPLPGEVEFGLDRAALLFSLAVAVASALLFGLAPALYSARRDLVEGLKGDERTMAGTQGWLRQGLVAAGVALSLVLVLSAGLLLRSFVSLVTVDLGFDPRNLLVRLITFPPETVEAPAERHRIYAEVLERIASIPGVSTAAATTGIPPFGAGYTSALEIPGRPDDPHRRASVQFCTAGYFQTAGVRFLQGNAYADSGPDEIPRHAVISRTLAAQYFPGADPVGRHLAVALPAASGEAPGRAELEIVGVVEDVRNRGLGEPPAPQVYLPGVARFGNPAILVRTSADPAQSAAAVRSAIRGVHRHIILREPGTLEDLLGRNVYAQPRFSLIVIAMFATAGTLLVGIGVSSVMAYAVSRQTRELALRIALGASRAQVMAAVLRLGTRLLLAGIVVGIAASFATGRVLARQLAGISPSDPATLLGSVALITLVGALACYVPARRAVRIDPMTALRQD